MLIILFSVVVSVMNVTNSDEITSVYFSYRTNVRQHLTIRRVATLFIYKKNNLKFMQTVLNVIIIHIIIRQIRQL